MRNCTDMKLLHGINLTSWYHSLLCHMRRRLQVSLSFPVTYPPSPQTPIAHAKVLMVQKGIVCNA